ncbi:MAG TPA: helix-turn-helix transcriptional regulator [Solirubrobacteraceae bacterium]|jgi:DNA-binding PadR family transcriptional regulator
MGKDPKISLQTLKLLRAMLDHPADEFYGRELGAETGLASGTLYPVLNRLENAGWLTSHWEKLDPRVAGRPPRRLYRLTGAGETAARAACDEHLRPLLRPLPQPRGSFA